MRNAWRILLRRSAQMAGSNGTLKDVDTAVVAGVRMYIRF